jgi:hypothetical protein
MFSVSVDLLDDLRRDFEAAHIEGRNSREK